MFPRGLYLRLSSEVLWCYWWLHINPIRTVSYQVQVLRGVTVIYSQLLIVPGSFWPFGCADVWLMWMLHILNKDLNVFDGNTYLPEQSHSVIQRADQQVRIFVPINVQTSRQRVPESPEPGRDPATPDHLQRDTEERYSGDLHTDCNHTEEFFLCDLARFCRDPLAASCPDHHTSCFMERSSDCKVWQTKTC